MRTTSLLTAFVVGCAALTLTPAIGVASPVAVHAPAKKHMKVSAKPEKDHVKVHEKTQLKGRIDDATARSNGPEALVVQELRAGVWVDLARTTCRPNGAFSVDLSFDVAARLSLRVLHPETTAYTETTSDVFAIVVV